MDWKYHTDRCARDPIFNKKSEKRSLVKKINNTKKNLSEYESYANETREELEDLEIKLDKLMEEYNALLLNDDHIETHYRYGGKFSKVDLAIIEEEN